MTTASIDHIATDEKGVARISGSRSKVAQIVCDVRNGMSPEMIRESYPHLSLSQIYAALSYYHDNKAVIDAQIASAARLAESMRLKAGPPPKATFLRSLLSKAARLHASGATAAANVVDVASVDDFVDQLIRTLLVDSPAEIRLQCFPGFVVLSELVGEKWYSALPISRTYLADKCSREIPDAGAAIAASFNERQNPFSVATVDGPVRITFEISTSLVRLQITKST